MVKLISKGQETLIADLGGQSLSKEQEFSIDKGSLQQILELNHGSMGFLEKQDGASIYSS